MSKTIEEILAPKPEARPRIYAYSIDDEAHKGLLKVGQTTRDVKQRVAEQLKTAAIKNYTIELDESAERDDGTIFTDHEVRAALVKKGFENTELEWMRCTVKDVKTVLTELRTGQQFTGTHHETFAMRREQAEAVNKTHAYFHSIWKEDMHAVPRFLWNAKMRFGKTFTTYQLAKKLGAKRVLVVTFKPAVEDAWQTDLESPRGLRRLAVPLAQLRQRPDARSTAKKPLVYFGSFQDLLGRDAAGNIKPKNEWLHKVKWDLVVFDEYHFGAWRETAKELFEGEEEAVAKKEAKLEYAAGLEEVNEDLSELSEKETEFLPITTKAYLYLSGTPFKALATGEFIEEQIFNWTYTDEQRAKEEFAAKNPGKWNPYGALPQMRLLTYQMPDELLAIASAGEFDEFDLNAFFEATGHGQERAVQAQERRAEVAGHHPRRVRAQGGRAPEDRHAAAVSVFGRAPAALPAALVLVPAQRRGLPRDGEPAGREAQHLLARLRGRRRRRRLGGHRARRAAARAQGHRERLRDQDHHALVRQAHHRRHRAAVVIDPDAAQPEVAGDLLSGRVPRAVAVVHQEPQRRQPERGGDPQARLLRVRLRAHARAAAALRVRRSACRPTSRTRRTRSRISCRSCPCWPTTART